MSDPATGRRWVLLDRVPSTSDHLREEILRGRLGEAAVLAGSQTAGRGRHGRSWLSPVGGLYLSVSIPAITLQHPVLHAVAAGLAVADLLRDELQLDAMLKWPNDVLVGERKICGILSEMLREGERTWIVIGVGLNVQVLPHGEALEYRPTSIAEALGGAAPMAGEPLARRIAARLDRELQTLSTDGGGPLLQRWRQRSGTLGQQVRITLPRGELIGEAVGLRDDFSLLVKTEVGTEAVEVGDCLHLGRSAVEASGSGST